MAGKHVRAYECRVGKCRATVTVHVRHTEYPTCDGNGTHRTTKMHLRDMEEADAVR